MRYGLLEYVNPIVRRTPYATTVTSRGCDGHCTFCTAPRFHGRVPRTRSVGHILSELQALAGQGYREVYFRDETFTHFRERNLHLFRAMLAEGLDLTWICNARVDTLDGEILALMRAAGCHLVKIGVESGSQALLDGVRKGVTLEQTRATFELVRAHGLDSHAHVMLGLPGETEATLEETIRFVQQLEPTTASFGICTPYPGTLLFDTVAREAPEIGDGSALNLGRLHVAGFYNERFCSLSADRLASAVREAYARFYLRPGFLAARTRELRSFATLRRRVTSGARVLDFALRGG
jgi:radical SAM superfamily enzyme YgiQ (UPF0313 family)